MSAEPRAYKVAPDSELSRLLANADREPVVLEDHGVRYRVVRETEDIWAGYDPEAAIANMLAAAGSITPEEAEEWTQRVYEGREAGTRPFDRP